MEKIITSRNPADTPNERPHPAANAWISVVRTYNLCSAAILRGIEPYDLNLTQHEVLINLLLRPGLSQQELAARCFSAKSGISAIVNSFERKGILIRKADDEDARKKLLFLTDDGVAQARRNMDVQNHVIDSMIGIYDKSELERLEQQMNEVSATLREIYK